MQKSQIYHATREILSIIFAVLFALVVNEWRQNSNNQALGQSSLNKIIIEIKSNQEQLANSIISQQKLIGKLDSLLLILDQKDPEISGPKYSFSFLEQTAWEAAKTTKAIEYIDIDVISRITKVYTTTKLYNDLCNRAIDQLIFAGDFESIKDVKRTLNRQKIYINSIISIGNQLHQEYGTFLKKNKESNKD